MSGITVVLDNVRSLYNVGAIMRACDGAGTSLNVAVAASLVLYEILRRRHT